MSKIIGEEIELDLDSSKKALLLMMTDLWIDMRLLKLLLPAINF